MSGSASNKRKSTGSAPKSNPGGSSSSSSAPAPVVNNWGHLHGLQTLQDMVGTGVSGASLPSSSRRTFRGNPNTNTNPTPNKTPNKKGSLLSFFGKASPSPSPSFPSLSSASSSESSSSSLQSQSSLPMVIDDSQSSSSLSLSDSLNMNEDSLTSNNDLLDADISIEQGEEKQQQQQQPGYERKPKTSHYLNNFLIVLRTVLQRDGHLFAAEELVPLHSFLQLDEADQRLFLRLHHRKGYWFQRSAIFYEDLQNCNTFAIDRLISRGGLMEQFDTKRGHLYTDLFHLLTVPELRRVLKTASIPMSSSSMSREEMLSALINAFSPSSASSSSSSATTKTSTNAFAAFKVASKPSSGTLPPSVKKLIFDEILGECVTIPSLVRTTIRRVLRLFFLNGADAENLDMMTMTDFEKVKWPKYKCHTALVVSSACASSSSSSSSSAAVDENPSSSSSVFKDREALLDYERALELGECMSRAAIHGDEELAMATLEKACEGISGVKPSLEFNYNSAKKAKKMKSEEKQRNSIVDESMVIDDEGDPELAKALRQSLLDQQEQQEKILRQIAEAKEREEQEKSEEERKQNEKLKVAKQRKKPAKRKSKKKKVDSDGDDTESDDDDDEEEEEEEEDYQQPQSKSSSAKPKKSKESAGKREAKEEAQVPLEQEELEEEEQPKFEMIIHPPTPFLARYSAGWIYASIIFVGVAIFEKLEKYEEACYHLRLLLDSRYCPGRRGSWYDRLSVDLEHLGRKDDALLVCEEALADSRVRTGDRLSIERRFTRLHKPPRRWKPPQYIVTVLQPAKEVYIRGRPINNVVGQKSVFIGYTGKTVSVEQLALEYYALSEGQHLRGMHCEGGPLYTLFALLMWDILFDDSVPFVFQTPFQSNPLDLFTDAFFVSRKESIEARLAELANGGVDEILVSTWTAHQGERCIGLNWERMPLDELRLIAECIGGRILSAFCRCLAEDYRNWSGGLPDLLLWNTETKKAKFSEVKGPRDRLSDIQRAWIDVLMNAGADVEVLHVTTDLKKECADDDLVIDANDIERLKDQLASSAPPPSASTASNSWRLGYMKSEAPSSSSSSLPSRLPAASSASLSSESSSGAVLADSQPEISFSEEERPEIEIDDFE